MDVLRNWRNLPVATWSCTNPQSPSASNPFSAGPILRFCSLAALQSFSLSDFQTFSLLAFQPSIRRASSQSACYLAPADRKWNSDLWVHCVLRSLIGPEEMKMQIEMGIWDWLNSFTRIWRCLKRLYTNSLYFGRILYCNGLNIISCLVHDGTITRTQPGKGGNRENVFLPGSFW